MKIVYHPIFAEEYSSDPAAEKDRLQYGLEILEKQYEFIIPDEAQIDDVKLVHTQEHIEYVKKLKLFKIALIAVGAAVKTVEISLTREPAFGLIRPPGHHASPDSSWGFCYFNNIAIAVEKFRVHKKLNRVLIADFDLHYGDGTAKIFQNNPQVEYYHLPGYSREEQLNTLHERLEEAKESDLLAVSAGFDRHIKDWGKTLTTNDYNQIGKMLKDYSEDKSKGRRFAVLEGGYNPKTLGEAIDAFIKGFK
ncbi:MAG: histone deacetylase family protein [Candidatus Odinarchaeia archaeon]